MKNGPGSGPFSFLLSARISLCEAPAAAICDFHCTRLSPMIFIEVIAAWLSDA